MEFIENHRYGRQSYASLGLAAGFTLKLALIAALG